MADGGRNGCSILLPSPHRCRSLRTVPACRGSDTNLACGGLRWGGGGWGRRGGTAPSQGLPHQPRTRPRPERRDAPILPPFFRHHPTERGCSLPWKHPLGGRRQPIHSHPVRASPPPFLGVPAPCPSPHALHRRVQNTGAVRILFTEREEAPRATRRQQTTPAALGCVSPSSPPCASPAFTTYA